MRTLYCVVASLLAAVCLTGCGWMEGSSGGVAVVDLDAVAKQIGATDEISQALKSRESNLNGQLQSLKANYVQQLEAKKIEFGQEPNEEQNTQLVAMGRQINLNLVKAQRTAQGNLNVHRAQLVAKFREQVIPIAEEIAQARGLTIVVPKNDSLILSVDDSVNITDEVAQQLKPIWK